MFNNISCDNFKKNLTNLIMNSQLPPVVAYYIVKDSLHDLQQICQEVIEYQSTQDTETKHEQILFEDNSITEIQQKQKKLADQQES